MEIVVTLSEIEDLAFEGEGICGEVIRKLYRGQIDEAERPSDLDILIFTKKAEGFFPLNTPAIFEPEDIAGGAAPELFITVSTGLGGESGDGLIGDFPLAGAGRDTGKRAEASARAFRNNMREGGAGCGAVEKGASLPSFSDSLVSEDCESSPFSDEADEPMARGLFFE